MVLCTYAQERREEKKREGEKGKRKEKKEANERQARDTIMHILGLSLGLLL